VEEKMKGVLDLSDLLDQMGAGDLYHTVRRTTEGTLEVDWVTGMMSSLDLRMATSNLVQALGMDVMTVRKQANGMRTSAVRKNARSDDDTLPMFPAASSAYGPSMPNWPAQSQSGGDTIEIDFDLVKEDASKCQEKYCRKCGTECKWIEMITSKFWGCPKC
jgi:hypothetical protein